MTDKFAILCYHYIREAPAESLPGDWAYDLSIDPSTFLAQMQWLVNNGYTAVTMEFIAYHMAMGLGLPDKIVVISFDDGHRSLWSEVKPVFESLGLVGQAYLVTDWIGSDSVYITWEQARDLQRAGLFEFGSHTKTHPHIPALVWPTEVTPQLYDAMDRLKLELCVPALSFAYPYGETTQNARWELEFVGHRNAVTTAPGINSINDYPYLYKRQPVWRDTTMTEFANLLNY